MGELIWADVAIRFFLLSYYGLLIGVMLCYSYAWGRDSAVPRLRDFYERLKYPTRHDKILDAFKTKMLGHSPYRLWVGDMDSMEKCIFTNIHVSNSQGMITIYCDENRTPPYYLSDGFKLLFESDSADEVFQAAIDSGDV